MQVKSLLVKVGTDTKEMERGLTSARGKMKDFTGQIQKMGRTMTVAGAAITGAVGLMVKGYVKAGDEVHKMALRTGMSTEALGELKYAAELGGTSIETIEKATKKMAETIGEAKKGLKTYTEYFALIGMEVEELEGLNPEEQFMKMAEGLADMAEGSDKAYAAQKLFGKAGTQLLPMLADGAEGLKKVREEAHTMSRIFDQEAANNAALLTDKMTMLKGSLSAATGQIADKLVPVITVAVEKITDVIQKVKDWIGEHPKLAGTLTTVVVALGGLMAVLGPLALILPQLVIGIGMLKVAFTALLGPLGLVLIAITAVGAAAGKMIDSYKKKQDEEMDMMVEAAKGAAQFWAFRKKLIADEVVTVEEWAGIYKKHGRNYQRVMRAISTLPEYAHIRDKWEELKKAQDEAGESGKELAGTLEDEVAKALGEVGEKQKTWLDYLKDIGIQTIEEKGEKIIQLTGFLGDIHQAYRDGKLDIEAYMKAVRELRGELEILSTTVIDSTLPATRDMSGVLEQAVPTFEAGATYVARYKEAVKEMTEAQQEFADIAQGEFMAMEASLKGFVDAILNTLERWAIGEIIVKVLKSKIPFPLNLLAMGGAILAIKMLFAGIRSMETGGFVPKETLAHLHPGEYVVNAPTVKALSEPGVGLGGGTSPFPNRLYNDITVIIGGERFKQSVVKVINEASNDRELKIRSHSVVN